MTAYVFCDESGKFKDHEIVSFGAVAAEIERLDGFEETWKYHLREYGLDSLTMKRALNTRIPFSDKTPALGVEREKALLPFLECAKRKMGIILGSAIRVSAFHQISSAAQKQLGKDPFYTAFSRTIIATMQEQDLTGEHLCVVCDDEEETAIGVYKLYRKLKLVYPEARRRLVSLSLADDEYFYPLQAADMIASLVRLEARRQFLGEIYEFQSLYEHLKSKLETAPQAAVSVMMADTPQLVALSESYIEFEEKYGKYGVPPLVERKPPRRPKDPVQ